MIGQTSILKNVDYWVETNTVPRFMIISGAKGSGKYTLAKEISRRMKAYLIECELTVEAVREAVKNCYKCAGTTVYLFRDADKLSTAAKNAMLKITEEPPRQAHFIITVENSANMLETLRSRATNISMAPYSEEELDIYYHDYTNKKNRLIREICDVPGMMDEMEKIDVEDLISFCGSVVDNIQQVTGVNAFKIVQKLKLKEDGPGHDLDLFFHTLKHVLVHKIQNADDVSYREKLGRMLVVTCSCYRELKMVGVKKDATLDMWVLMMREA